MKTRVLLTYLISLIFISYNLAQSGSVGIGTATPDGSAKLDISSTDHGLLIPRMSKAQKEAISTPATGLMVYQSDTLEGFYHFSGSEWIPIGGNILSLNHLTDVIAIDTVSSVFIGQFSGKSNTENGTFNVALGISSLFNNTNGAGNSAIGHVALHKNITGSDNTGTGSSALFDNTTGDRNTATGSHAMSYNTTGFYNTATGYNALGKNTTGARNTAIGNRSLGSNSNGNSNTAVGDLAIRDNKEGDYNVALGNSSGIRILNAEKNTFLGYESGWHDSNISSQSGVIKIGYQSGKNDTTDNKLFIENSNSSFPLIYGDFANDTVKINGTLGIKDEFIFPIIDGTVDQIMKTDGNGKLSWSNLNQSRIQDGNMDTKIVADNSDLLRFYIKGIEYFRMETNTSGIARIETINPGGNIIIGESAGSNIDTSGGSDNGVRNIMIGWQAGALNTTGSDNIFMGHEAGHDVQSGEKNTAIGVSALNKNVSGVNNTAIGRRSLKNTKGSFNVALGQGAGENVVHGLRNTYLGNEAGGSYTSHSQTGAINIGFQAGFADTTNNKLYIENSGSSTPLIYGDFTNDSIKIYGTLSVGDQYTFPASVGTFGQVLAYNGSDALLWTSLNTIDSLDDMGDVNADYGMKHNLFGGKNAGLYNPSGSQNVAWGESALRAVNGGSRNVAVGYSALDNINNGSSNVAIGNEALHWTIDKVDNIAIGDSALYRNGNAGGAFDGIRNIAIGSNSLKENTTGTSNIAIGLDALRNSQTGDWNIAMGTNALLNNSGESNVSIGSFSLAKNTSGNKNTSIGDRSLNNLKDGNKNTSIGSRANLNNVHGNKNVTIGYQSMNSDTTGSENTIIGTEAMSSALATSNTVAIGFQAGYNTTGGGNIFLGHKAGYNETGSHNLYIDNSDTSSPLIYGDFISDSLQVNGKMRVNCTNSAYDFVLTEELNEPAIIPTEANYGYLGTASNYLYKTYSSIFYASSAANYLNWSDRRLKENIQTLDGAVDRIMQLQPVKYDLKEDFHTKGRSLSIEEMNRRFNQSGFIAQNLERIYPNMVVTDQETDLKAVSYVALIPEMVSVIQEQQMKIDNLEKKIKIIMELLGEN